MNKCNIVQIIKNNVQNLRIIMCLITVALELKSVKSGWHGANEHEIKKREEK